MARPTGAQRAGGCKGGLPQDSPHGCRGGGPPAGTQQVPGQVLGKNRRGPWNLFIPESQTPFKGTPQADAGRCRPRLAGGLTVLSRRSVGDLVDASSAHADGQRRSRQFRV